MAYTYQDIIDDARVLLNDTDSDSYRYTDEQLTNILNRAFNSLLRIRPDAFYGTTANGNNAYPTLPRLEVADLSDPFLLNDIFINPLVEYVVGMAEITDDEYTEDSRAATLLGNFKASLTGT